MKVGAVVGGILCGTLGVVGGPKGVVLGALRSSPLSVCPGH